MELLCSTHRLFSSIYTEPNYTEHFLTCLPGHVHVWRIFIAQTWWPMADWCVCFFLTPDWFIRTKRCGLYDGRAKGVAPAKWPRSLSPAGWMRVQLTQTFFPVVCENVWLLPAEDPQVFSGTLTLFLPPCKLLFAVVYKRNILEHDLTHLTNKRKSISKTSYADYELAPNVFLK